MWVKRIQILRPTDSLLPQGEGIIYPLSLIPNNISIRHTARTPIPSGESKRQGFSFTTDYLCSPYKLSSVTVSISDWMYPLA